MFRFIGQNHAFSKGCSLWIAPQPSDWAKKMDWHLCFLFEKSKTKHEAFLAESSRHLPNDKTLFLSFKKGEEELWIKKARKFWQDLEKPSLRIFLNANQKDFTALWPEEPLPYRIQILHP